MCFDSNVLRVSGYIKQKIGGRKRLHNEVRQRNLCARSTRIKHAWWDMYTNGRSKSPMNQPHSWHRRKLDNDIRMVLRVFGRRLDSAKNGGLLWTRYWTFGFHKIRELLAYLQNYQFLKAGLITIKFRFPTGCSGKGIIALVFIVYRYRVYTIKAWHVVFLN
jgi:hypothetical protein